MLVEVRSVAVHVDYNKEVDQQPYGSNAEGREVDQSRIEFRFSL